VQYGLLRRSRRLDLRDELIAFELHKPSRSLKGRLGLFANDSIRERLPQRDRAIKTVDLKCDMPLVSEALQRLETELTVAVNKKVPTLKLIHGYGSTGAGGDIRIAVQKRLIEMVQSGRIRACIFGEDWSKSNERAWRLVLKNPQLKDDPDLGRRNRGITIVVL
jgi:hypothetical protein